MHVWKATEQPEQTSSNLPLHKYKQNEMTNGTKQKKKQPKNAALTGNEKQYYASQVPATSLCM